MRDYADELDKVLRDRVHFGDLFDAYSTMLTEKQRALCDLLLGLDLSIAELGEELGMTRQGAFDLLKRSRERLEEIESSLGLLELRGAHESLLELIHDNAPVLPEEFMSKAEVYISKGVQADV
ncbi:MAG: DNA-binding protein [Synergistaceae bacterium]|nr:DNA-binding protein [Synergistaceae bacterium]